MKILSIYAPLLRAPRVMPAIKHHIRPAIIVKSYHSAEYSGGGLIGGRDNYTHPIPTPPSKGPEDPFAHLELAQLTDPRSVSNSSLLCTCSF